jgi:hypothetical protein
MCKIIALLVHCVFFLSIFSFTANAFYCGDTPINEGTSSYTLEKKCGAPLSKTTVGNTSEAGGYNKLVIERWVYEKSGYRIIITVVGDVVSTIHEEKMM